jgi:hypothetical protein
VKKYLFLAVLFIIVACQGPRNEIFTIGPYWLNCSGYEGQTRCLEINNELSYIRIQGFTFNPVTYGPGLYEEGYSYVIKVEHTVLPRNERMEDADSSKYKLIEIISKTPAGKFNPVFPNEELLPDEELFVIEPHEKICTVYPLGRPTEGRCLVAHSGYFQKVYKDNRTYNSLDQSIIGFDSKPSIYEEGYVYVLKVKVIELEEPPQDGSNIEYHLVEVISKTPE